MADVFDQMLTHIRKIIDAGLDADAVMRVLEILESPYVSKEILEKARLYSETLPKAEERPFTPEQRYLHFLWDAFDKLPLCLIVPFSIPFRRILAERLFARCGRALVVEENVRFNFGQFLSVGDNVFFNRNVFLDTKGGVEIGDAVGVAEDVRIFTHGHDEASHMTRSYAPVRIGSYAKIYAGATIMPGVTVGEQAIVASGAVVTHDVPPNMVAAGIPAKVIRERRSGGRSGEELEHIWLF
ncbi:acyltransferase [Desulfolutivibrio sulfoxidireducens]|uniref:acyltransferase n=1 Tax=Desulfolutivibrio sulfoxidireducens TaxID=2773299 RepID=UPI00159D05A7|nr:acyltransferase [Desulfolutivibrio sulfoxidireducens]QLA21206.1 acyltransferase [Desulfolutivibrio sulfoxidireducens]